MQQHIQREAGTQAADEFVDGCRAAEVQRFDPDARFRLRERAEFCRRCRIAAGRDDLPADARILPYKFESDAAIGTSDEDARHRWS